jgi:two-component system, NtrC family, nitrogen regulation response regulator GlnG
LYHRLNVIRLRLPALRERREDIPMLTRQFLNTSARQLGVEPKRIADSALSWLSRFNFPGNVRQLENICHWLTVMAPAQVIETKDLPPEVEVQDASADAPAVASPTPTLRPVGPMTLPDGAALVLGTPPVQALVMPPTEGWETALQAEAIALLSSGRTDVWDVLTKRFESRLIQTALDNTKGRRIEAAHKLGIGRNTITRKIQELGLE